MLIGTKKGLPGEFILLFTILIWLLFALIYISNRQNKLNRWCFISGMCFSMGVFKEYLYFTLTPYLAENYPNLFHETLSVQVYSVLTAVLYYFSMPAALIFAFYFANLHERRPRAARWFKWLVFIPSLVFGVIYPYIDTRHFQLYDRGYYLAVAVYNGVYGVLITAMILLTLKREHFTPTYRQKKMVAVIVLVPIWYWLLSAFLVHLLGLKEYFKAWQGNLLVILFLIIYYLYNAFQGGIMGARLKRETYNWSSGQKIVNLGAQFTSHYLKNETAKIDWCLSSLKKKLQLESPEELEIIARSTQRLHYFVDKTQAYSRDVAVTPESCGVCSLLHGAVPNTLKSAYPRITFTIACDESAVLFCDKAHVGEILSNLVSNAVEAIDGSGKVSLSFSHDDKRRLSVISISDDGAPIPPDAVSHLFEPYYSTKKDGHHFGLGLYYCRNVMEKHGGKIEARCKDGVTSFTLYFPDKCARKAGRRRHG